MPRTARDKTDYVVITECLDADRVCIGHRGTLRLAIETRGKKSHGSIPDLGVNALDKMVKLILVPTGTRVVEAFMNSGERVLGRKPSLVVSPGSDDQKFVVQEAGIHQCIIYGPGPLNLAHRNDEYVEIEDLLTSVKIMALAAMDLLGCEEAK